MFFGNISPRRFRHKFIYVDERQELLDELERRHKGSPTDAVAHRNRIAADMNFSKGRNARKGQYRLIFMTSIVLFLFLIVIVAVFLRAVG